MSTAPLPGGEDARLAALYEYRILDTAPEDAYDDIVRLAAYICATPIAAVTLIDAQRQWFKAAVGMPRAESPHDAAFCAYTILQPDLFIVPDTRDDPRFADNPFVMGDPYARFYAGAPLIGAGGHALGALCVIDQTPRSLTPEQEAALRTLAHQVTNNLELARRVAAQDRLIAERQLAAELAQAGDESLRQLGAAVECATEGIIIADARQPDLPTTYANPAFLALTGYEMSEVLGRNCRFIQGADTDPDARQRIRHSISLGLPCRVTLLNYRKDGSTFWNELTVAPVRDGAGEVTHFVGVQHDITALKEAEAARREAEAALRQSNHDLQEKQARLIEAQRIGGLGDWELDVAALRFTWSAEVFRLMEFDPDGGEPPYEAVQARYHPEDRAGRDRLFARALETGEPYQYDLRLVLPSGTPRWCHLVGRPVLDAGGRVTRVVGTALDITERIEREQQISDANTILEVRRAQLEAANADLRVLATTDPVTGVLNYRAFHQRLGEEVARAQREGTPLAVAVVDLDDFSFFNGVYGSAVGDAVLRQVAARLLQACGAGGAVARFGGDEFWVLAASTPGAAAPIAVEARLREVVNGLSHQPTGEAAAIPITVTVGAALLPQGGSADGQDAARAVLGLAEGRLRWAKTGGGAETEADRVRTQAERSLSGFSMLDALVTAVDNKDRYTRRHSEDVLAYSLMIARELALDERAQETVSVASLLHDVGKIGVPDHILRKPGALTDVEFEAVRQHPMMGAIIVQAVPGLEDTLDAVRHHHERWDGQGYPFGLRGEETPLIARLMAVADAFSAMTTDRPYRKGMERERALSILSTGAGSQWDPDCVRAFLQAMGADDGEAGR